ncbi:MAG: hypothetical protein OEZ54_09305, partial [Gemmatimonadota bacterium]|nr:hypothetical protein [Gemmatimonadota bacterium]
PPSAPPADLTFIQPESAPPVLPPPEDVPDQLDEEPPLFGEDDLPGKPLRAARDEVSLSSVFGKGKSKVNVAQPGKPGASFDEFFGKTVEEDVNLDDMAQDEETDGAFRAWLRGLKS